MLLESWSLQPGAAILLRDSDCDHSEHLLDGRPYKKISMVQKIDLSALQELSHLILIVAL